MIGAGSMGKIEDKILTSVLRNASKHVLILSARSGHQFVPIAKLEKDGEYAVQLCMNWAYREFHLEYEDDAGKELLVTSDDCCDYERITISERNGQLVVDTVFQYHIRACSADAYVESVTTNRDFLSWFRSRIPFFGD